jgi:hypothetical protein
VILNITAIKNPSLSSNAKRGKEAYGSSKM